MFNKFFLFLALFIFNLTSSQAQTKTRQSKKELKNDVTLQAMLIDSLKNSTQIQDSTITQLRLDKERLEDSITQFNSKNNFLLSLISDTKDTLNNYRNEIVLKQDTINQLNYKIDSFISFQNHKKTNIPYLKRNGKYIYVDATNLKPLSNDEYDEAGLFNQYGLAIVGTQMEEKIKYGLINSKGEIILPIKYNYISDFKNHKCVAIVNSVEETNALGTEIFYIFIDSTGKVKGDKIYSFLDLPQCDADDLSNFYSDKPINKISKRQQYGLMGSNFEELLPCSYEALYILDNYILAEINGKNEIFDSTGKLIIGSLYEINGWNYSEGFCPAVKLKKWGYLGEQSKWLIQPEYEDAGAFSEGIAPVKKWGKWGYINKLGSLVIPFQYEDAHRFSEGFAIVKWHEKWIFINKKNERLPIVFSELDAGELNEGEIGDDKGAIVHSTNFINGLAAIGRNGKWDLINTLGKIITSKSFDFISGFIGKSALVRLNDLFGIINSAGKVIAPPIYEDVIFLPQDLYKIKLNERYGIINSEGVIILPIKYEDVSYLSPNFFGIELNGKWGIIDKNNKVITPFKYDEINSFSNGFALVKSEAKSFFIDENGMEYTDKKAYIRRSME